MLNGKERLLHMIQRAADGKGLLPAEAWELRNVIERLDELDDALDAVCTCRTQEIPTIRERYHVE